MDIAEKALECHKNNMNCAQSVLCACTKYTGMNEEDAKCIAAGFGGGLRSGEVCGAIAGAVMAVGLAKGKGDVKCGKAGSSVAESTQRIVSGFRSKYGCTGCAELIKSADGKRRCDEFIVYCAQLAASEIEKE